MFRWWDFETGGALNIRTSKWSRNLRRKKTKEERMIKILL
jgi:hypothetical protein